MDPLDRLEAERGGEFRVRHESGQTFVLPSPLDLSWKTVATLVEGDEEVFRHLLPGSGESFVLWKIAAMREAWVVHYGLPDPAETRRLVYYLQRYAAAIEADLMRLPGFPPLADAWRSRQWRRLLNAIDHLPRNSFFAEAVAGDEEHAEMILRAQESVRGMETKTSSVPFSAFSDEVAVLADISDRVQQVALAVIASNTPKGGTVPEFKPQPRPVGAQARIKHKVMLEKHEKLANRMLARRQKAASN